MRLSLEKANTVFNHKYRLLQYDYDCCDGTVTSDVMSRSCCVAGSCIEARLVLKIS